MVIYTTADGLTKIETTFDGDTVWLSIDQMAELFQRDKSTISRHIKNIFEEECSKDGSMSIIKKHWKTVMQRYRCFGERACCFQKNGLMTFVIQLQ